MAPIQDTKYKWSISWEDLRKLIQSWIYWGKGYLRDLFELGVSDVIAGITMYSTGLADINMVRHLQKSGQKDIYCEEKDNYTVKSLVNRQLRGKTKFWNEKKQEKKD